MAVSALKRELDQLLRQFSATSRLPHDPLQFARRFLEEGRSKAEIEAMALFSAMLSYGKVDLFLGVIRKVLTLANHRFLDFINPTSPVPAGSLKGVPVRSPLSRKSAKPFPDPEMTAGESRGAPRRASTKANGLPEGLPKESMSGLPTGFPNYRLSTAGEIWSFARAIGWVVQSDGGLFPSFHEGFRPQTSLRDGLISLRKRLRQGLQHLGVSLTPGLAHLLPDPALGGACKRWLMFLRWVVRSDDGLDLGLWPEIPASTLLIPIDRHVSAIARALGLTARKADDWKTTEDITASLRRFDPDDPVKYDFAIAHLGISGTCTHGRKPEACGTCRLRPLCSHGRG